MRQLILTKRRVIRTHIIKLLPDCKAKIQEANTLFTISTSAFTLKRIQQTMRNNEISEKEEVGQDEQRRSANYRLITFQSSYAKGGLIPCLL